MSRGTIKKLITNKGFGFIDTERGELFFHTSAVQDTVFEQLHEGQQVEYEEGMGPKGRPCATSVKPAGTTNRS